MDALTSTAEPVHGNLSTAAQSGVAAVESRQTPAPVAGIDDPIMAIIRDPSIDLERVKAALALRKELADEEERKKKEAAEAIALKAFNEAFLRVQSSIPIVVRDEENKETHSQFATLARIGDAIDKIVSDNGFTCSFYPLPETREGFVRLQCILSHVPGGFERRFDAEVPVDNIGQKGGATKTAVHGWRSSTTYIRRTLYELIFNVKSRKSTPDDDGNAAGKKAAPEITKEEFEALRFLIAKTNTTEEQFFRTYEVARIEDMTGMQYGEAITLLKQKAKRLEKSATEQGKQP